MHDSLKFGHLAAGLCYDLTGMFLSHLACDTHLDLPRLPTGCPRLSMAVLRCTPPDTSNDTRLLLIMQLSNSGNVCLCNNWSIKLFNLYYR